MKVTLKEKQAKKWEKTRKLGPWKYALIYGTIWAVFVVVFVWIFNLFFQFDDRIITLKGFLNTLFIYWIIGIIMYRYFMWKLYENGYQFYLKNKR